ncbi:MAG: VacJ family lipoprotein [Comamonadaceae bacterium]|nr:VacJ family lipoprotein [Comamonadaceae bacterium]MBN9368097.1 VacJ family lipoprotein [Comamonadaceae bacterium]
MTSTTTPSTAARGHVAAAALLGAALLAGCASGPQANPADPFEGYNRAMSRFNDDVDGAVVKPVATAYKDVVPGVARQGVTNVFANLGDAWSFVNNLLQLQLEGAFNSAVRFSVNTVLGIGGLFDIASEAGVERHKQDFGLTMARWGVPSGPYLVLPLLGPSSVRDTAGFVVDWEGDIVSRRVNDIPVRNSLYVLRAVNKRANLLGVTSVLDYAALDKYAFTRDAYLQMRAQQAGQELPLNDADDDAGRLPPEE